MKDLQIYLEY